MKTLTILLLCLNFIFAFNLKEIKTMKASFEQIIYTNDTKVVYRGNIYLKYPYLSKWEYLYPVEKDIYTNKKEIIIYEKELNRAVKTKISNISMANIINSAKKLKDNTYISKIDDIDYYLHIKGNQIDYIKYKDNLDSQIKIYFKNIVMNQNIPSKIFKFNYKKYKNIELVEQ